MNCQNNTDIALRSRRRRAGKRKTCVLLLSLLLMAVVTVSTTLAYLVARTEPLINHFEPAHVSCEVTETFDGTEKKNVNVTNTGSTDAYIRVRLVSYRVNADGEQIGGTAELPGFELGDGWKKKDDFFYYTSPVAPGEQPAVNLTNSMILKAYEDADGGRQVVEVMAEAIQSLPAEAVHNAWGVTVGSDGKLIINDESGVTGA